MPRATADEGGYGVHVPGGGRKAIRAKLDMTQEEFAGALVQCQHAAPLGTGFAPARGADTRLLLVIDATRRRFRKR